MEKSIIETKVSGGMVTSLELVKEINMFREQEGNRAELQHKSLLGIIRDEFEEEIGEQRILPSSYINSQNKKQPMFELTYNQAKQVLLKESKFVRKAIIKYVDNLENKLQTTQPSYQIENTIKRAERWIEEEKERQQAFLTIEENKPKVLFANAIEESKSTILIDELAKLIKQNGVDMGQNRLFKELRKEGYLGVKGEMWNLPTQTSMNKGLFEIKTSIIQNPDGSSRITKTSKVTGKGQQYFINKYLSNEK